MYSRLIPPSQQGLRHRQLLKLALSPRLFNHLNINVLLLHEGKALDMAVSHHFDVVAAGTEEHALEAEKKVREWSERMDVLLTAQSAVVLINRKWFKLDNVRLQVDPL